MCKEEVSPEVENWQEAMETTSPKLLAGGIAIVSNVNERFQKRVEELAEELGMRLVMCDDSFVTDYAHTFNHGIVDRSEEARLLKDYESRVICANNVIQLYAMMTGGRDASKMSETVFNRTQLAKATRLTHSQLQNVLATLQAYGFVEFVKGTHEFRFIVDPSGVRTLLEQDFRNRITELEYSYNRLISAVEFGGGKLTKTARQTIARGYRKMVREKLEKMK